MSGKTDAERVLGLDPVELKAVDSIAVKSKDAS